MTQAAYEVTEQLAHRRRPLGAARLASLPVVTHLFGIVPLMGWVFIAIGAITSIRWWRDVKKHTAGEPSKPGGKVVLAVEAAMSAAMWLIGGALVVYPVAPAASVGMVMVAAYCIPVAFVGTGLLAVLRLDDLVAWMGWPPPEERWQRGILRGVGVTHTVAGLGAAVLLTYLLLEATTSA